jgi:hypothetical protein
MAVEPTGLSPGQRLLLVVALVLGVLTMHATPVLCSSTSAGSHAAAMTHGHSEVDAAAGHDKDADCGDHHALAACLAILVMGVLLAALRLLGWLSPGSWRAWQTLLLGPIVGSRAPPRATSVRLAQLCVSRR